MNNQQSTINYQPVIGLEVHVELKTKSKMFCGCSADYFGKEPNTHTCPVCLGLPGALPVPNKTAIDWCIKIGLALNCDISGFSKFDRKNYFYPDLAKGYQISQYDKPFCENGGIILSDNKRIRIRRVHMEEDTAKLTHQFRDQKSKIKNQNYSLIDFNRSGVPLVEIVTEPDFKSVKEVIEYLKKLQQVMRYLEVSDADMEKGQMRLEPNISLRPQRHPEQSEGSRDSSPLAQNDIPEYKVEVKNINSFRFVEKAINFEIKRQTEILEKGEIPQQETRGWNEGKGETVTQRTKEEAMDYRYFPEPDIPPFSWTEPQISNLKSQIKELPDEKIERFVKDYKLSEYDASHLTRDMHTAEYFEEAINIGKKKDITPKQIANMIINKKIDIKRTSPSDLASKMIKLRATTVGQEELEKTIQEVVRENEKAVADYKKGKENALMFLVGQVIKKVGKVNTEGVKKLILNKLSV